MIAIDTETAGRDFYHGCLPFLVTTCDENGDQLFWEAEVDPLTRQPMWSEEDKEEIAEYLASHDKWVLHNARFDLKGLECLGVRLPSNFWERIDDTLIASHLLATNKPHNLTDLAIQYLGRNPEKYEKALEDAVKKARTYCRKLKGWKIAREGIPELPSIGGSSKKGSEDTAWRNDYWLPRAVALVSDDPKHEPWLTVLSTYANLDSNLTALLWPVLRDEIKRRGLWAIYQERMKLLPIAHEMETRGVTVSADRLQSKEEEYRRESERLGELLVDLAAGEGCELKLPAGAATNRSMTDFYFKTLKLPVVERTDSGAPSLKASALENYLLTVPPRSVKHTACQALLSKRKRDTATTYMRGYRRFWLPLNEEDGWYLLHPRLNPTGTATLRWSSQSPNEQNISAKEDFNLRYAFGPAPGREWWSLDAKNLELRIPAYESGEEAFIALFERPDDPPYFGSNHLLISHILHPRKFEECRDENGQIDGRIFKKRYKSTLYHQVKCGNFAVQYGAIDRADGKGTADIAYGVPGAQAIIASRFSKQEELNQHWIRYANKHGYVETMPDRSIDPTRGYPILCSRTDYGKIKPTVPLNYHVQGTACWWAARALVRCYAQLSEWRNEGFDGYIPLYIHDEIVFDLPRKADPVKNPGESNLGRVRVLQKHMEQCGVDLGVPTPVSVEYHPVSWDTGISL